MWNKHISQAGCGEDRLWNFGSCRVISLVGSGGKTTLMDHWASVCAKQRKNVLVTTTTHLQIPHSGKLALSMGDVHRLWMDGSYAVIGTVGEKKLSMPDEDFLEEAMDQADLVFIEADGSKRRPCKVPNRTEPVILEDTDLIAAVLGMSAVGKPIEEGCFRLEEMEQFLGKNRSEVLTEEDAANILASEHGSRKDVGDRSYLVVLNQCDTPQRKAAGERIAQMLLKRNVAHILLTSFSEQERGLFEKGNMDE